MSSMASYTLGNWDGSESNSRDTDSKQPQTPKTSLAQLVPPATSQLADNTVQAGQGTVYGALRMDPAHGARNTALLMRGNGSGAARNEGGETRWVDPAPLTAEGIFDSHVIAVPSNASRTQDSSTFYEPTQSYVIPPLSNGATYAGPTPAHVAPTGPALNGTNYAGPTQPYVVLPLKDTLALKSTSGTPPVPSYSPTRAATTYIPNASSVPPSGSRPAQAGGSKTRSKASEQHFAATSTLTIPNDFHLFLAPPPQSFTPATNGLTKVLPNNRERHSRQADSSQSLHSGRAANQVNTASSASVHSAQSTQTSAPVSTPNGPPPSSVPPPPPRPRAKAGRKPLEQHRKDAIQRDGVYSTPPPQARMEPLGIPNTSVPSKRPCAAVDLANALNSLGRTNANPPERSNVRRAQPSVNVAKPTTKPLESQQTSTARPKEQQSMPASTRTNPQSSPQHYRAERPGMQAGSKVQAREEKQKQQRAAAEDKNRSKAREPKITTAEVHAQSEIPSGSAVSSTSLYSKQAFDTSSLYGKHQAAPMRIPLPRPRTSLPGPSKADSEDVSTYNVDAGGEKPANAIVPPSTQPTPLRETTSTKVSPQHRSSSPLFTPPPLSDNCPPSPAILSVDSLFTPTPSPQAPVPSSAPSLQPGTTSTATKQPKNRVWMSHVYVLPLPKGLRKADYRSLPTLAVEGKGVLKEKVERKRSRADVQVHPSLEHALNNSLDHNARVGVLPEPGLNMRQSSNLKADKGKDVKVRENMGRRDDVASSSKAQNVAGIKRKLAVSGQDRHHRKLEAAMDAKEDPDDVRPKKRFKHTKSNHTSNTSEIGSGAGGPQAGTSIERIGRYGYTKYNAKQDVVRMLWDRIKTVPAPVLAMNIRHLGRRVGVDHVKTTGKARRKEETEEQGNKWFVWPIVQNPVYEMGDAGELVEDDGGISVGRSVKMEDWREDEEEVVPEQDEDDVSESWPQKVDLAGHLQERDVQKEPSERGRDRHGPSTSEPFVEPLSPSQHTPSPSSRRVVVKRSGASPQRGSGSSSKVKASGCPESEDEGQVVKPSARALGKRKAVSPSSPRKKTPGHHVSPTKRLASSDHHTPPTAFLSQSQAEWVSPGQAFPVFPPSFSPRSHQQRSPISSRRVSDPTRLSATKKRLVSPRKGASATRTASQPSPDHTTSPQLHVYRNAFGAMQAPSLDMQSSEGRSSPSRAKSTFRAYSDPEAQNTLLSSFAQDVAEDAFPIFGVPSALLPLSDPGDHDRSPFLDDSKHSSPFDHLDLSSSEMERERDAVPWAALVLETQYEFDTIDTTLLRGEEAAPEGMDVETEAQGLDVDDEVHPVSPAPSSKADSPRSSSPLSPASKAEPAIAIKIKGPSSSSQNVPVVQARRRSPYRNTRASEEPEPSIHGYSSDSDFEDKGSASSAHAEGSKSKRIQRQQPNLGSSRKRSRSQPEIGVSSELTANPPAKTQKFRPVPRGFVWDCGLTEAYCHQCRTKVRRLRMKCRCKKEYCNRCISSRYPDIIFKSKFDDGCPLCMDFCNCTACCFKRGDTYVKTPADTAPGTSTSKGPRVHLGGKTNLPPLVSARVKKRPVADIPKLPPATHTITGPVEYWGTVYSLNGEKVATGFVGAEGDESVVFARELLYSRPVKKRLFVGAIQRSWGLGRKPAITDLHPASPAKKKASRRKERRVYVGDRSRLAPHRIFSIHNNDIFSSFDAGSPTSSLTSVSDTEEENEMNEETNLFSPDSLCDDDITRALKLGLSAVGVLAVVEDPSQSTGFYEPPPIQQFYVPNSGGSSQVVSAFPIGSIPDAFSTPSIVSSAGPVLPSIQQGLVTTVKHSSELGPVSSSRSSPASAELGALVASPPSADPGAYPPAEIGASVPPTDMCPPPAEFDASLPLPPYSSPKLSKEADTADVSSTPVSLSLELNDGIPLLQPPQLSQQPATTLKPHEATPSVPASCHQTTSHNGSVNPSAQHEESAASALSLLDTYDSSSDTDDISDKDTSQLFKPISLPGPDN